jgi:hypothetical protein
MWGQQGDFTVNVGDMPVHIVMDGMIGASAGMNVWPAFSANVASSTMGLYLYAFTPVRVRRPARFAFFRYDVIAPICTDGMGGAYEVPRSGD